MRFIIVLILLSLTIQTQACGINCALCSATNCTECTSPTTMYTSALQCVSCNSPLICTASVITGCIGAYYLNTSTTPYSCVACQSNCLTCTSTACTTCVSQTAQYINGMSCISCSSPLICSLSTISGCISSYYLNTATNPYQCTACGANCAVCSSSACSSCISAYSHYIDITGIRCSTCSSPLICSSSSITGCSGAYYLNTSTSPKSCVQCGTNCATRTSSACIICNSQTLYYLVGTICIFCTSPLVCSVSTISGCSPSGSFYLSTISTPYSCVACLAPLLCSSSTITGCSGAYYLSGVNCIGCPVNCITCNSTTCIACSGAYYPSGQNCLSCTSQCSVCTSTTCSSCVSPCLTCNFLTCLTCISNYYKSGTNCLQCQSSLICTSGLIQGCSGAYYFNTTTNPYSCSACGNNCNLCSLTICTACSNPSLYYIDGSNCTTCTQPFTCSNSIIIGCQSPYYLDLSTSPHQCVQCGNNCQTCHSTVCISCVSPISYYTNGINCTTCNFPLVCDHSAIIDCVPDSGYYFDAITSTCVPCGLNCAKCTQTTCILCTNQTNYYITGVNCNQCNSPLLCASSQIIGCNPNLPYYQDNSTIPPTCIPCGSNCASCTSLSCTSCLDSYYIEGNICSQCISPMICSNSLLIGCQSHYYLNLLTIPYQCIQCGMNCLQCNLQVCIQCITQVNYYIDGYNCKPCNPYHICASDQIIGCIANSGYYYDQITSTCINCQLNCQICTSVACISCANNLKLVRSQCLCEQGYFVYNQLCRQCQSLCQTCQSQEHCFQCKNQPNILMKDSQCICQDGYYQENNNCLSCVSSCKTCIGSSSNCITCSVDHSIIDDGSCLCQSGYFMIAPQTCQICYRSCIECSTRDQCTKCQNGYYLSNHQCLSCDPGCNECQIISNTLMCKSCQAQYDLVNFNCIQPQLSSPLSTQNFTIFSSKNSEQTNQFEITTNQIIIKFNFLDIYQNNNVAINITYLQQPYFSTINQIDINNFNQSEFSFICQTSRYNSYETHEIIFDFTKSITKVNLIEVKIEFADSSTRQLQSIQILSITPNNFDLTLPSPHVSQAYDTAQYALVLSIFLSIGLGGLELILAICDILAWLSTFYYLNVTYPINVKFFLENCNLQQYLMLPNYIPTFNQPNDLYYFESPYKFMQNSVDPLFMSNILNDCALIVLPIMLYIASRIYNKIEPVFSCTGTNPQSSSLLTKFSIYLHNTSQYYIKQIQAIILKQIHLNMLDLMLACCLQLMSNPLNSFLIVKINTLAAIFTVSLIITLCYFIYLSTCKHPIFHRTRDFRESYDCIYENLHIEEFNHRFYGCMILYSKILYIFFLVAFYHYPLLQTGFCAGEYFILVFYVLYSNPYQKDFIREMVPNICVLSILLTTVFLAINERIHILADIEIVGWIILNFIGISLIIQFYFLFKHFFQEIVKKFKNKKLKPIVSMSRKIQISRL